MENDIRTPATAAPFPIMLHPHSKPTALRCLSIAFIAGAGLAACAVDDRVPGALAPPPADLTSEVSPRVPHDVGPTVDTSNPILALAGTIVVREPDGTERRDVDGVLSIIRTSPNSGGTTDVEIVEGRWQLDLFRDSEGQLVTAAGELGLGCDGRAVEYGVFGAKLDGDKASAQRLRATYEPSKFGDCEVDLLIRRSHPIELTVRDAATGEHLNGICVAATDGLRPLPEMGFHELSTTLDLVTRDACSPFSLTPTQKYASLFPRTYCIASPGYRSQSIDLDLLSGGSRPVLLERDLSPQTEPNEPMAASAPLATEIGEGPPQGAGRRAMERALAAIRARAKSLGPTRVGTANPMPSEDTLLTPELVDISVLALDDSTGAPMEARHLLWSTLTEDDVPLAGYQVMGRDVDDTHFRVSVPKGPVRLRFCSRYFERFETVIATDGATFVFEIDVNHAAGASIRLVDGETTVPWPRSDQDVIDPLDGERARGIMASVHSEFEIGGARPGRYRIRIPQVNGYEPHPPVEFDLVAGETSEIVIDLVRSR